MAKNLINGQKPEFGNIEQIKLLQKEERKIAEEKEAKMYRSQMNPMEKYIDDISNIDWIMMMISDKIKNVTEKLNGRSPIDIMIDKTTGYEKSILKDFLLFLKEGYKELIKLFKRIGDKERHAQYVELLAKINASLETEYKSVKNLNK